MNPHHTNVKSRAKPGKITRLSAIFVLIPVADIMVNVVVGQFLSSLFSMRLTND
jgi:hypothetical protein